MTIKDKILAELGELQSNARINSKAYITALIAKGIVEKHFAPEVIPPQPAPAGLLEWLEKTIAQSERTAKDTCEDAYDITERGARENTLRLVIDKVRELGEARPDERVKGLADYLDACTEYYTQASQIIRLQSNIIRAVDLLFQAFDIKCVNLALSNKSLVN